MLYSYIIHLQLYTYTCRCMQNQNNNTIKTTTQFLEKYTSHFNWKGCVWKEVGDRTKLQHIDPPTLMAISVVSFPFSRTAQPEAWEPTLLGAGFLCRILSPTGLVSKLSDLQTHWLPVFTELYNSSIAPSISPHNWQSECVTYAVFRMACLVVIKWK